jgi:RNA polymerase sigma-70 factor (ECF subfamily)
VTKNSDNIRIFSWKNLSPVHLNVRIAWPVEIQMTEERLRQCKIWYQKCSHELHLYAQQLANASQAEDLVQEAFIKLMTQKQLPDNPRAWLFCIIRRLALGWHRRLKIRSKHTIPKNTWFEQKPEDLIDAKIAQATLEGLPVNQREIVVLRIWGQLSLAEIAKIVKKPVSTVHHHYHQSLTALRLKMERQSCLDQTP